MNLFNISIDISRLYQMIRIILLLFLLSGCATQNISQIKLPEALPDPTGPAIIYSVGSKREIDNNSYYSDIESEDLEDLEGYLKVTDSARVENIDDVQTYIDAINEGFGDPESHAMCFEPRHAIAYPSKFGQVTAHICFACRQVSVSLDGWGKHLYFVSNPRALVDVIYQKYGVRKPVDWENGTIETD